MVAACYSSIKHHKLKIGAEGEEEIGDSQELASYDNSINLSTLC